MRPPGNTGLPAVGRIAVDAPENARIVGSDIRRLDAAAPDPARGSLEATVEVRPESTDQVGVDALSLLDAQGRGGAIATRVQGHASRVGKGSQSRKQFLLFCVTGSPRREGVFAVGARWIALCLAIQIDERQVAPAGGPFEPGAQGIEPREISHGRTTVVDRHQGAMEDAPAADRGRRAPRRRRPRIPGTPPMLRRARRRDRLGFSSVSLRVCRAHQLTDHGLEVSPAP